MNNTIDPNGHDVPRTNDQRGNEKSPERLEREVDQARARLGKTVSDLSDRLSPGQLIDQALGMAREHGGEFGRNLGAQVKQNPIPMILTGIGISWMMMSSGTQGAVARDKHGVGQKEDGRGSSNVPGDAAQTSRDKAAAVGNQVQGATAHIKESAQNARDSLVQFYRDQPLLAGSVGIAIGAALGALVPATDIEDDMLGDSRDRSVAAAKSKAVGEIDELRQSVQTN